MRDKDWMVKLYSQLYDIQNANAWEKEFEEDLGGNSDDLTLNWYRTAKAVGNLIKTSHDYIKWLMPDVERRKELYEEMGFKDEN